jgi:protocatechuate 3,4-dioxygenase beta subunit
VRRLISRIDDDDAPVGRILTRREVLALLGGAAVAACAPAALASPSPSTASSSAPANATVSPGASQIVATPACIVVPELTQGPYFVDEKLNRTDIRADASGASAKAGAQLDLTFNVARVSGSACTALGGATVDVWHCDALGVYSDASDPGFDTKGQKWLRGYQTTDASGVAKFTTIYPGWYQGRAVHIHFKIRYPSGSQTADFTSQLFFDETVNDRVFAAAPYSQKGSGRLRNTGDQIYQQSAGKTLLSVTPNGGGYAGSFSIGLS